MPTSSSRSRWARRWRARSRAPSSYAWPAATTPTSSTPRRGDPAHASSTIGSPRIWRVDLASADGRDTLADRVMANLEKSLERAYAKIERSEDEAALDALLGAWRERRLPRIADLVDRVSDRL